MTSDCMKIRFCTKKSLRRVYLRKRFNLLQTFEFLLFVAAISNCAAVSIPYSIMHSFPDFSRCLSLFFLKVHLNSRTSILGFVKVRFCSLLDLFEAIFMSILRAKNARELLKIELYSPFYHALFYGFYSTFVPLSKGFWIL